MPQVIEKTAFTFAELEGAAKDRAAEWFLSDYDFDTDCLADDFLTIAGVLGVSINTRTVKLFGGGTRQEPILQWSGFYSQGDGASFEGSYKYERGAVDAIAAHAPQDAELGRLARKLQVTQQPYFYMLEADITTAGRYQHSGTMSVELSHAADRCRDVSAAEDAITEVMQSLADWFYRHLESEYEHQTSEEVVAEAMEANGYLFDEDGRIA